MTDTPDTTTVPRLDVAEQGADGQSLDRRLFMQFHAFSGCTQPEPLRQALEASGLDSVLYLDISDPQGVGVLVMTEDPAQLVGESRTLLSTEPFASLTPKPQLTMTGRTYAIGHERDLEDWIIRRPRRNALNPEHAWAVWYPLRRKPEFTLLRREEQGKILREHAAFGMRYGEAGYAADIRLACHGLDTHDNDFVLGVVGPNLQPLSRLVQDMRRTQQTAKFIQSLGPFFIGKTYWQRPV